MLDFDLSRSGIASPSRSPRVRLAAAVANCDCSYHSKKESGAGSVEEDDSDLEEE